MKTATQTILESFNQLPKLEKHKLASEIIKSVVMMDLPPLTDEALSEIADALFIEHDEAEINDAKAKTRRNLVS